MTNNDVSPDEKVRASLGRYQERFQPARADWASVEARHASHRASRHSKDRPWWKLKLTTMAVFVPTLAAMVIVMNLAHITVGVGQTQAQARSAPPEPPYAFVTTRPSFPAGSTMAAIQAQGFITVGVKDDQPGFGFKDPVSGTWSGYDIEMAKLTAAGIFGGDPRKVAGKIHFVPVISADRESFIESGRVDLVIATYTITSERKQFVDFAGPYFRAHQDIMVKAGDASIKSVADLNGRDVCTVKGSTSYQNLRTAAPHAQLTLLDIYSACAHELAAGRVEAVTTDNVILAGLVHQYGFIFKLLNSPFSDEPYGIGLKKGDELFRAFLNQRLITLDDDGDNTLAANYALQGIQGYVPPPIDNQ
jgi:glutamate transport system substrate-binding protein